MKTSYINLEGKQRKIAFLEYSISSPSDIINMSEVRLDSEVQEIYHKISGEASSNGPLDLRMGISHKDQQCQACQIQPSYNCPGHFGYLELDTPIYHLGFFRHVINSLNCICKNCGQVKLPKEEKENYKKRMKNCIIKGVYRKQIEIFKEIVLKCKKIKECANCEHRQEGIYKKLEKVAGKIIYQKPELSSRNIELKKENEIDKFYQLKASLQSQTEIHPLKAFQLMNNVPKDEQILFAINPYKNSLTDLLTTIIPAPPNLIRPTVVLSNNQTREDDLTGKIKIFLRQNNKLIKSKNSSEEFSKYIKEHYLLQSHYFHYFNSNTTNLPINEMRCDQQLRSLYDRLKGKRGRFRQNLMGKRVNFAARTVISPDPNLPIDQVKVPEFMAKILTVSELVNKQNIFLMRKLVLNGRGNYPGANSLFDGIYKIDLQFADRRKYAREMKVGWRVDRHLQNNDVVLFNRQPSLHRMSIMAFRANVDRHHTLRFNVCACTPFNADFDGDEMNLHLPQTLEARAEALEIMSIKNNLCTQKSGECIVSVIQDFLTSSWILTNKDTFFSRSQFCQLCACFSDGSEMIEVPPPSIIKPVGKKFTKLLLKELWTGKQVFNALLRPNRMSKVLINLEIKESNSLRGDCTDPKDGYVIIDRSELVCGNVGKKVLGPAKNGLFYILNRDNCPDVSASVMLRIGKLASRFLNNYGMTIGIGDVTPSKKLIEINQIEIKKGYDECIDAIDKMSRNLLERVPGQTIEQTLESMQKNKLSNIRDEIGKQCQQHLKLDNKVLIMFQCGAKGSNINMSQMIGCVGQQVVSGKRVPDGFIQRSLPHFKRNDPLPRAKGFVKNSFYTGMDAIEFFFHTMGGREGLIDTAVKTADTGYMQRRLIKMLEDLQIAYDMTVRSCDTKEIVQFIYGGDGLDPQQIEDQSEPIKLEQIFLNSKTIFRGKRQERQLLPFEIRIEVQTIIKKLEKEHSAFLKTIGAGLEDSIGSKYNLISVDGRRLEQMIDFTEQDTTISEQIRRIKLQELKQDYEDYLKLYSENEYQEWSGLVELKDYDEEEKLQKHIQNRFKEMCFSESIWDSEIKRVQRFWDEKAKIVAKERIQNGFVGGFSNKWYKKIDIENEFIWNPLNYISQYQLEWFMKIWMQRFKKMLSPPGTSVGPIASQSIGEPATQMTLKTFHFAGVASMNVTQGVPRIKEIINAAKTIKTPILRIKLEDNKKFLASEAYKIHIQIEKTMLSEIISSVTEHQRNGACYLEILLDIQAISKLQLKLRDIDLIDAIAKTKKLGLKPQQIKMDRQNAIKIEFSMELLGKGKKVKNILLKMQEVKNLLCEVQVAGFSQITQALIDCSRKDSKEDDVQKNELIIYAQGYGLREILQLDGVNTEKTKTNHILEIYSVLGIEAARKQIISEIVTTMSAHGINLDLRHILLAADTMTFKGKVLGFTRHGVQKLKNSTLQTLMLASFEKTMEILFEAAIQGKNDSLNGVSQRIILGQNVPIGTGLFDLLLQQNNKEVLISKKANDGGFLFKK